MEWKVVAQRFPNLSRLSAKGNPNSVCVSGIHEVGPIPRNSYLSRGLIRPQIEEDAPEFWQRSAPAVRQAGC